MSKIVAVLSLLISVSFACIPPANASGFSKLIENGGTGHSIIQTIDGGYVVTGVRTDFDTGDGTDSLLIKLNASGNLLWKKRFSGMTTLTSPAFSLLTLNDVMEVDQGFLVVGATPNYDATLRSEGMDMLVMKISSNGQIVWSKVFGSGGEDQMYSIAATKDGGSIASGSSGPFMFSSYRSNVVKFDRSGKTVWINSYDFGDFKNRIFQTTDGGFILSGSTTTVPDIVTVVKLNQNGGMVWKKNIKAPKGLGFLDIVELANGGYALEAYSFYKGFDGVAIVQLSSNGALLRSRFYEGVDAKTLVATSDQGLIIGGQLDGRGTIFKIDSGGQVRWIKGFDETNSDYYGVNFIRSAKDGGYILTGTTFVGGQASLVIMKVDANGDLNTCRVATDSQITSRSLPIKVFNARLHTLKPDIKESTGKIKTKKYPFAVQSSCP